MSIVKLVKISKIKNELLIISIITGVFPNLRQIISKGNRITFINEIIIAAK